MEIFNQDPKVSVVYLLYSYMIIPWWKSVYQDPKVLVDYLL